MSDSNLSAYTAADGDRLVVQDWPLPEDVPLRGVVLIVHGLGEHAGRYDHLAMRLNEWGFMVRGYDQHGHGESGGEPGSLARDTQLIEDLADIVDSTRMHMDENRPLILLGHSLGGLVAARLVALHLRPVDGLVLSSPAFDIGLSPVRRALLQLLARFAPNLRVSNGLDDTVLSHDPAVAQAYRTDFLIHRRISMRLAGFMAEAGPRTLALAPRWQVPTLLMYAGDDRIVRAAGSRAFAAAAPPERVTAQCFEGLYHEIFNERDNAAVFELLQSWLDAHFPSPSA